MTKASEHFHLVTALPFALFLSFPFIIVRYLSFEWVVLISVCCMRHQINDKWCELAKEEPVAGVNWRSIESKIGFFDLRFVHLPRSLTWNAGGIVTTCSHLDTNLFVAVRLFWWSRNQKSSVIVSTVWPNSVNVNIVIVWPTLIHT